MWPRPRPRADPSGRPSPNGSSTSPASTTTRTPSTSSKPIWTRRTRSTRDRGSRLYYLATIPSVFGLVAGALTTHGCVGPDTDERFVRVVVEKPYGRDLASAIALDEQMHAAFDESQIYRIDHYMGKERRAPVSGAHAAPSRIQLVAATLRWPGVGRSIARTAGFNVAATAAAGLGGIILARAVGPTVRGEYAAITAWFGIALMVGGMGQPGALCFHVARDPLRAREYVATSRAMMLATGTVVLVSGMLLGPRARTRRRRGVRSATGLRSARRSWPSSERATPFRCRRATYAGGTWCGSASPCSA